LKKKLDVNNGPKKKKKEGKKCQLWWCYGRRSREYRGLQERERERERERVQTKHSMEGENRNVLAPSSNARGACAVVGKLGSAFS
jgi:hypothetical protein